MYDPTRASDPPSELLLKTLRRYLDDAKQKHGLTKSDQLSKKLGIPPNHVSQWYHRVSHPGDEGMVKLARLLKINPLEIIASVPARPG